MTVTLGTPTGGANLGNPFVNTLTITEPPTVQFGAGGETVNSSPAHLASRSRSRGPSIEA